MIGYIITRMASARPMVDDWKTHKPVSFVRSHVLSIRQQYKHKTT